MTACNLLGIGLGPFNLGLAALLSSHDSLSSVFLERKPEFRWHEGLLMEGTTLQVPFLADLVTMTDPTHPLSYLNYLRQHHRLYNFYFYERFLIPRLEYDDYCRWASQQLASCRFGETVENVSYDDGQNLFRTETIRTDGSSHAYLAHNLALGIGTVPYYPAWAQQRDSGLMVHSSQFNHCREQLQKCKTVTVIGSGQSAAECVLALYSALTPDMVSNGASVQWISRSAGFFPMEYSKLGLEYFSPDYMQYFHTVPREKRRDITRKQGLLYKGISISTIAEIFDLLYERSVGGVKTGLTLIANCNVNNAEYSPQSSTFRLSVNNPESGATGSYETDAVILGTGYHHVWPEWFTRLKNTVLATDNDGDMIVDETFCAARCDDGTGKIFIQNAETFHHGVGAPDLGLGAYRNATIINQLLGQIHYPVPVNSSFQQFGL